MRFFSTLLFAAAACAAQHDDLLAQFSAAITPRTWDAAHALAATFVSELSALEKIALTTGTGIAFGPCSGNVAQIEKLG
jgi:hypothetical protein